MKQLSIDLKDRIILALAMTVMVLPLQSIAARAAPDAPPQEPAAAQPEAVDPSGPTFGKRGECRADAGAKRLRGPDRVDAIELCVAQARLSCLKQAIAAKIQGPARLESIRTCVGK